VVLDAWSRRIVGWAMAAHLRTELVLGALDMALVCRCPSDVIYHSDRGCQYTPIAFGKRCREVFEFTEGWYNTHRRHSALDYTSPIEYERRRSVAG